MQHESNFIQQLPLFPLSTVLFPGGLLPLRIFEIRYLDMIKRCHANGSAFGVVTTMPSSWDTPTKPGFDDSSLRSEDEDGIEGFAPETFYPTGTLAHIQQLQHPQPGLISVRCVGGQRFKILTSEQKKFGLWLADIMLIDHDPVIPVPADLIPASETLQQLVRSMEQQLDHISKMPLLPPYHWNDCGWVSNRWCELLPVETVEKQRLMSLDNPLVRLELISDILGQMGLSQTLQFPL